MSVLQNLNSIQKVDSLQKDVYSVNQLIEQYAKDSFRTTSRDNLDDLENVKSQYPNFDLKQIKSLHTKVLGQYMELSLIHI